MASQPSLVTKMQKLPMTFLSPSPANKMEMYILCTENIKMDLRGERGWDVMEHKEHGIIVLKVLRRLEEKAVRCWQYGGGDLVYCQEKRAWHTA